ncbi:type IV pilus biogenesis protein EbsA [Synechococcus elongatus]|uniref:type IV pilus biogenesis protein EbsA n=1 Tax=Synechococcus elongatus TaxID=32046 RepID=UPI000F7DC943|nr:type IV pilus biogenesis protein EbsA [Synechococcus elongatus]
MRIDELVPADPRAVSLYTPYYSQANRRRYLPYALSLYQGSSIEGSRAVEGGAPISFVATWTVTPLPADMTRCHLQFNNDAELTYEILLPNHEFLEYLIDMLMGYQRMQKTDFPGAFYRRLLGYDG